MSDSLLTGLAQQFGGDTIGQLAGLVGADQQATGKAVAAALPMLLGSLTGAAKQPSGAEALFGALSNDHDGSVLDMLGPLLGGGYASRAMGSDGSRILSHLFGNKQPAVEQTVAQSAGISSSLVSKLLPYLAPIVMGYLSKRVMGGGGGDAGLLGSILGQEKEEIRQQDSGLGGLFDLLGGGDDKDDGGGLMDAAGDLLGSSVGKAILGQILK